MLKEWIHASNVKRKHIPKAHRPALKFIHTREIYKIKSPTTALSKDEIRFIGIWVLVVVVAVISCYLLTLLSKSF